jgi:hypothetical protein
LGTRSSNKRAVRQAKAVAVFVAFALVDAEEHTTRIAFNILDLEPDDFADAQAGGIRHHEQSSVFGIVGGRKEVIKLFDTEDSGQLLVGRPWRQIELHGCPAQGIDREKPDGSSHDVARTPRELTLSEQMVEIASNLLRGELIGGAFVVGGEAIDGFDILVLGARSFAMELHVLDHFGT